MTCSRSEVSDSRAHALSTLGVQGVPVGVEKCLEQQQAGTEACKTPGPGLFLCRGEIRLRKVGNEPLGGAHSAEMGGPRGWPS